MISAYSSRTFKRLERQRKGLQAQLDMMGGAQAIGQPDPAKVAAAIMPEVKPETSAPAAAAPVPVAEESGSETPGEREARRARWPCWPVREDGSRFTSKDYGHAEGA